MTKENVELVRSIVTAWEGGDYGSAEWAHPKIEFVRADGPSPRTWKGSTGMAEGTRDWISAWQEARMEAEEYRELDDEQVLVFIRFSGRGKTSGLDLGKLEARGALLFQIQDGRVSRFVHYLSRDRALADLEITA
jgi:ketosteroid isomerase-like protein